jgi:hypothetical protein
MLDKSVWDKEIPVPQNAISYVDDGILRSKHHLLSLLLTRFSHRLFSPQDSDFMGVSDCTTELPEGTKIVGISPSGASYWARTAKIKATNAAGDEDNYFVKVSLPLDIGGSPIHRELMSKGSSRRARRDHGSLGITKSFRKWLQSQ